MGSKGEAKLRLRADKVNSELFDLHSDLRAVERRIRVLGCSNVGGKSRVVQRDLSEAREQKGRIQGQIRAAESLLDSVLKQMKRQQQVQRSSCSRGSSSAASASHTQQGGYHSQQFPLHPHATPAKHQSDSNKVAATSPRHTDPKSESDQGSFAVHSASTQSQRCHTAHADMSCSGHVGHRESPTYLVTGALDTRSRVTCTVATSMGDLSGTGIGQRQVMQDLPMRYQKPPFPWLESPASPSRPQMQRTPEHTIGSYCSPSNRRQLGTGPREGEAHFSDINSLSPYTDISIPVSSKEESRAAAVQNWIEHHSGVSQLRGPESVQSESSSIDARQCASLDAFLHQDASSHGQISLDRRQGEYHGSRAPHSPYQRRSLSIFDSPQEPSPVGAAATSHVSSASAYQQQGRYQADACVAESAASPATDSDIPKIEKWLRAIGKARGWDLGLLDDLLKQNLAGVLASDTAAEAQDRSLRISQMNPRDNPLALQAYVTQCDLQHTDQHCQQNHSSTITEQTARRVSGPMNTEQRRGTADTLVHAAWAHLLHRPMPSARHPHANLLQKSFELLERPGTNSQAPSSENIENKLRWQEDAQGAVEHSNLQSHVTLGPQLRAHPDRSAAGKISLDTTTNLKSPTTQAGTIDQAGRNHDMLVSRGKTATGAPKAEKSRVTTPRTGMDCNQAVRTRRTKGKQEKSEESSIVSGSKGTSKKGLRVAGPSHVAQGRKAKRVPQFLDDDLSLIPGATIHPSASGQICIPKAGPLFSDQMIAPSAQEQHMKALDRPLSIHTKRSSIKSHRLVFEEGELEAIAAGVDLQEWKRLMRNAGESSRLNYYHQAPNTDWCHPLESTCPSVSEDVPTLVQSPEPNGVCGNIHSAMSNKRDVDPVVRKSHTRVTRSALFRAAVNPSNLESIAEDLN